MGAIIYDTNVLGFKGPRKMSVVVPGICDPTSYRRVEIRPISDRDSIVERWKSRRCEDLIVMHNKTPVWNEGEAGRGFQDLVLKIIRFKCGSIKRYFYLSIVKV